MLVVRVELKGITKFKTAVPFGNTTVAHRDKTLPTIQTTFQNPKPLPRIQNTSQKPKTHPRIQNTCQNPKHLDSGKCFWILGSVFGFWDVFWILGSVFGFWEVFLDSGKCFEFWEVFCPYEPR